MVKNYEITQSKRSIMMLEATGTNRLVFRIRYQDLSNVENTFRIENPFIVYILYGKNDHGKDVIYVGKSTNGLKNRPKSHSDKYHAWTYCYVLTQYDNDSTFFNDATIQYLEDCLNAQISSLGIYENTTQKTNSGTANRKDKAKCDEYLEAAIPMLDVLGLDLITSAADVVADSADEPKEHKTNKQLEDKTSDGCCVPDGTYYLTRRLKRMGDQLIEATMRVVNGQYVVLKGSAICLKEGVDMWNSMREKRKQIRMVRGKLAEDVVFDSPSAAAVFIIGGSANGWAEWKNENGEPMAALRNDK